MVKVIKCKSSYNKISKPQNEPNELRNVEMFLQTHQTTRTFSCRFNKLPLRSSFLRVICIMLYSSCPLENVWSSSRKCWRKTGKEDNLRSRNRSWGCSAVSNPRWASLHISFSLFFLACPLLVLLTLWTLDTQLCCAQTGEKSRDDALEAIKGNLDGFSRDAKMHPTPSSQTQKPGTLALGVKSVFC